MDKQRAERAIVQVGNGRGFLVADSDGAIVVTAAHCLPHLPTPHPALHTEEHTYADLLGVRGDKAPKAWATLVFADPISDVAVLAEPDNQQLFEEWERFEALVGSHHPVRLGRIERECDGWLLTLAGAWVRGRLRRMGAGYFLAIDGSPEGYAPGTSGSPIFNDRGEVVASVSCGDRMNPILWDVLPRRLTRGRKAMR